MRTHARRSYRDLLKGFRPDRTTQVLGYRGAAVTFAAVPEFEQNGKPMRESGGHRRRRGSRSRGVARPAQVRPRPGASSPMTGANARIVSNLFGFEEVTCRCPRSRRTRCERDWKVIGSPEGYSGSIEGFVRSQMDEKFARKRTGDVLAPRADTQNTLLSVPVYEPFTGTTRVRRAGRPDRAPQPRAATAMVSDELAREYGEAPPIAICVSARPRRLARTRCATSDMPRPTRGRGSRRESRTSRGAV